MGYSGGGFSVLGSPGTFSVLDIADNELGDHFKETHPHFLVSGVCEKVAAVGKESKCSLPPRNTHFVPGIVLE